MAVGIYGCEGGCCDFPCSCNDRQPEREPPVLTRHCIACGQRFVLLAMYGDLCRECSHKAAMAEPQEVEFYET